MEIKRLTFTVLFFRYVSSTDSIQTVIHHHFECLLVSEVSGRFILIIDCE